MADRTGLIIVIVIALITAALGSVVVAEYSDAIPTQEELSDTRSAFQQYCTEAYGSDASVYLANDAYSADHNGFHCTSDEGTMHLSQIPDDVWMQYKQGEVSAEYVRKNLEPGPGLFGFPNNWPQALAITLSIAAVAFIIGRFQRYRDKPA